MAALSISGGKTSNQPETTDNQMAIEDKPVSNVNKQAGEEKLPSNIVNRMSTEEKPPTNVDDQLSTEEKTPLNIHKQGTREDKASSNVSNKTNPVSSSTCINYDESKENGSSTNFEQMLPENSKICDFEITNVENTICSENRTINQSEKCIERPETKALSSIDTSETKALSSIDTSETKALSSIDISEPKASSSIDTFTGQTVLTNCSDTEDKYTDDGMPRMQEEEISSSIEINSEKKNVIETKSKLPDSHLVQTNEDFAHGDYVPKEKDL